jgi:hypothetical protein
VNAVPGPLDVLRREHVGDGIGSVCNPHGLIFQVIAHEANRKQRENDDAAE